MNTTRLILLLASAFSLTACVDDSPLRITGLLGGSNACGGSAAGSTAGIGSGSLDIAPASRQQSVYLLGVQLTNTINPPQQLNSNQLQINEPGAGNVNLKEAIINYSSSRSVPGLRKESVPIGGVILQGGVAQTIGFNVITKNAAESLGNVLTSAGDTLDLNLTIQIHGTEQAGGDVYSTTVNFPLHVFQSGTTCASPDFFGATGPCGATGGQDGTTVCCASDPNCKAATTP